MKRWSLLAAMASLLLASCGILSHSDYMDAGQVESILSSGRFMVEMEQMNPLGAPTRQLDRTDFVKIDGDMIISELPFVGTARNVPYGGGKALHFKEQIDESSVETIKDCTKIVIRVVVRPEATYIYDFQIFDNGRVYLDISSDNRSPISFHGLLCPFPEESR